MADEHCYLTQWRVRRQPREQVREDVLSTCFEFLQIALRPLLPTQRIDGRFIVHEIAGLRVESYDVQLHLPTAMTEATHLRVSADEIALPLKILGDQCF